MNRTRFASLLGAAAFALGVTTAAVPASAHQAAPGSSHGTCSADSSVKISGSDKGDTIKVKAKIKSNGAGEQWDYTIADNGTTVVTDSATSNDNGTVKIRASIPNLDGADTIDLSATNAVTGEVCTAETTA
jgi:hypothetical protein